MPMTTLRRCCRAMWGAALAVTATVKAAAQAPADSTARACASDAYRQMDFWLGRWTVRDPSGKLLGTNEITRMAGGCALREVWTSASGSHGESISAYDSETRRWHQFWVDRDAHVWRIDGQMQGGAMVMTRVSRDGQAPALIHRWTWSRTPDGGVRQLYELSSDGGTTWRVEFDGRYTRER